MTTRIAVVVGNPSPKSRTRQVAEDLAARIADITGSEVDETIELAEVAGEVFEWKSDRLDTLTDRLATADYAVIATPTYKASYTGLLKAFLDRYDAGGLHGLTAVPVFTIGSPAHTLGCGDDAATAARRTRRKRADEGAGVPRPRSSTSARPSSTSGSKRRAPT
jgi:FMN reductase